MCTNDPTGRRGELAFIGCATKPLPGQDLILHIKI
jgi:hypothetical protein